MDNKETKTNVGIITESTIVDELKEVRSIIFIMFAEFLGYESALIEWAEKICKGSHPPKFVEEILKIEAITIFKEMQKDYTLKEIRKWYDEFYPVILEEYEQKLIEQEKDDLPF